MRVKQLKVRNVETRRKSSWVFSFLSYFRLIHAGEIILDDLSFDILEALKNVDEVKEEENTSSKKRKTRNSYTNRIREVVVDEDSEEEYSPPKKSKTAVFSSTLTRSLPKSTRIMFTPSSDDKVDTPRPAGKKLLCSLCKKIFFSREAFEKHAVSMHGKKKIAELPKRIDIKSAVKIVRVETEKCSICRLKIPRNEMGRHMESHQQKCKDCSFKCKSGKSLEVHRRAEHMFKCKKCKATLATKEALGTHTTVAHMFKCQKCGSLFEHKILLEKHFRASHMFKCTMCPQILESTAALASHETAKHQSCEVCEDEFSWAEASHSCYYTRNNIKPTFADNFSW